MSTSNIICIATKLVFFALMKLHVAQTSSEPIVGNIRTGTFEAMDTCQDAIFMTNHYKDFEIRSLTECGLMCLKDEQCLSVNFGDFLLPTTKRCFLYDSAAESCEELDHNNGWKYLRLIGTNNKDAGDLPNTPATQHTCHYSKTCSDHQHASRHCSKWQLGFEIDEHRVSGDKSCFLKAVKEGASVRIELQLWDSRYYRLSPLTYIVDHSSGSDIIYFQFAPRYYAEDSDGNGIYETYIEYIGLSTEGYFQTTNYSTTRISIGKSEIKTLKAVFYIRHINCKAGGSPTFDTDKGQQESLDDLIKAQSQGAAIAVRVKDSERTIIVQDLWSFFVNKSHRVLGVVKYGGQVFSVSTPMEISHPLLNEYEVRTTDEYVNTMQEDPNDAGTVKTVVNTHVPHSFYVDSYWELAYVIFDHNEEDEYYNTAHFKSRISEGGRVRIRYSIDDVHHSKDAPKVVCSHVCLAFGVTFPGLKTEVPFQFTRESNDAVSLYFSQQVTISMLLYDAKAPKATVTPIQCDMVSWYVDSMIYQEVFSAAGGSVQLDTLQIVVREGSNLQLKVFTKTNFVIYYDVDQLVSKDDTLELYSAFTADYENTNCGDYSMSKVVLTNKPFSLRRWAWSLNFQVHCALGQDLEHIEVSVLVSKGWR